MINAKASFTEMKDYIYFTAETHPWKFSLNSGSLEGTSLHHIKA